MCDPFNLENFMLIEFTTNHASFVLISHMVWKISMKSIFSNYYYMGKPQAMLFVVILAQADRFLFQAEDACS